jgi:hypothetical protein
MMFSRDAVTLSTELRLRVLLSTILYFYAGRFLTLNYSLTTTLEVLFK